MFCTWNLNMATGNNISLNSYSSEVTVVFATSMTLIMLFTVIGNILVIIAVLTHRPLRVPQNLFLVSLAAANILVATLVMPLSLVNELMGYWYFHPLWCNITLALNVLFCSSSIIHLCTISLDRYLSISRPIQYGTQCTPRKIKGAIVVVWLISAIISFPPLIPILSEDNKTGNGKKPEVCILNEDVWYILYSCIGSFFVPCLIMILVYVRIYQIGKKHTRCPPGEPRKERSDSVPAVQSGRDVAVGPGGASNVVNQPQQVSASQQKTKHSRTSEDTSSSGSDGEVIAGHDTNGTTSDMEPGQNRYSQSPTHRNIIATPTGSQLASPNNKPMGTQNTRRKAMLVHEKRFTFVLAVVIGVFIICWFPFFFTYSLKAIFGKNFEVPEGVFKTFFWLGYCNSALNPLIYTSFNRDFRRAFRKILCKSCKDCSF